MAEYRNNAEPAAVLVVGGGVGGMRAALDIAEAGLRAYLIEKSPTLGGRVAQLGYMFPSHDCVLCRGTPDHGYGCTRPSISPAFVDQNMHPNIEVMTLTEMVSVEGQAGDFTVTVRQNPRYVDVYRCINCGKCSEVCPVDLPDLFQQEMLNSTHKAAYKVSARAAPDAYLVEKGPYCDDCGKCAEVCPTNAINLDEQPVERTLRVGAIILAMGFQLYDPARLDELGYGRFPNVVHSMEYERLASRSGPTEGIVVRPSDRKKPDSIAWLQCVGSRDVEHMYCSSICCMYSTKEAMLAKQRLGDDTTCQIFLMDERAFNKEYNAYYERARNRYGVEYTHCRISGLREDPETHDVIVRYMAEDGHIQEKRYEMAVLSLGLEPPREAERLARMLGIRLNEFGFCLTDTFAPLQTSRPGIFVCGAFSSPKEIVETIIDASGAAGEVMRLLNDKLDTYDYSQEWPFLSAGELPPERDVSGEPPRIGVFACRCEGAIGDVVDLQKVIEYASGLDGVVKAEVIDRACFNEMKQWLVDTIEAEGLNRVVFAACSNRTHDSYFQKVVRQAGLNPYLMRLTNIREQVAWVHSAQPEMATRKATELVRIAVEQARKAEPVHKIPHRRRSAALVIGGGAAGMTAALTIADSGYEVHLVERSPVLGGNLLNIYYVAEGNDPQRLLRDLVNRVRAHTRINVYTRTEVVEHGGHIGDFWAVLRTTFPDGHTEETRIQHGAVIVATGARETREEEYPILRHPNVMTQRDLEHLIVHQPEKVAAFKQIVTIQCVRPEGAPVYCSRVCCTNTMKNAIRVKMLNPDCQVIVLYKDIMTYSFREQYYTEARRRGVIFMRYNDDEPPEVITDGDEVRVRTRDLSLNVPVELPADAVFLSTAVAPSKGTEELAKMLRLPLSTEGFFMEAQIKLRPMDFMEKGIFLAGMAHYPKFIDETLSHAMAAASRALSLLSQEPLYVGGVVAVVDSDKCVGCLTCTRTCPFGIPQVLPDRPGVGGLGGSAYIDPARCQGCGTCTGECPANAIQLVNYRDDMIMLKEIGGLGTWLPELTRESAQ